MRMIPWDSVSCFMILSKKKAMKGEWDVSIAIWTEALFSAHYGRRHCTWGWKCHREMVQISFETSITNKILVRLSEPWKVNRLMLALTQWGYFTPLIDCNEYQMCWRKWNPVFKTMIKAKSTLIPYRTWLAFRTQAWLPWLD